MRRLKWVWVNDDGTLTCNRCGQIVKTIDGHPYEDCAKHLKRIELYDKYRGRRNIRFAHILLD